MIWSRNLGLVPPASWGLLALPCPWSFTASAPHQPVSRTLLSLHRDTAGSWNAACWAVPPPHPLTACATAALHGVPLSLGLWDWRKGTWGKEPRGCQRFRLGVQLWTFPHPSPGLPQHNCPTLSKWRPKPNTEKSLRFAKAPQRLALLDLTTQWDVQLYQQRPVTTKQIPTKTSWPYRC